jgi:hypothetical protein
MMRTPILTILTLFFTSLTAFSSGPLKGGSLTAESDGSDIVIRWATDDEANVRSFELERKAGLYGQFFLLVQVTPKGSNSTYEYVDDSALRLTSESIYQYRLKIVSADGTSTYSPEITVIHAVSSVRRTWGSIKAMFR